MTVRYEDFDRVAGSLDALARAVGCGDGLPADEISDEISGCADRIRDLARESHELWLDSVASRRVGLP